MPHPIPILLLLVTARSAAAQQSENDKSPYGLSINSTTAILTFVVVSFFFLLGFFSVYFLGRSRGRSSIAPVLPGGAATASRRGGGDRRGLEPALIEAFPILTYSEVTSLKIGGEALECAVCLSEFAGDETLRMLPSCCHVFHPECVDTWLQSHVTCPVCRSDLSAAPSLGFKISGPEEEEEAAAVGEVAIDLERMGRSHSTGHVMKGGGRGGDRFTLRLPEHVRREIVVAGSLRRSASVAVFGSGGERSGRRGYRGFWVGRSDRWATGILARVGTWRRGEAEGTMKKEGVEGSARGGTMFNCLGGGAGSYRSGGSGSSIDGVDAGSVSTDQVMDRV